MENNLTTGSVLKTVLHFSLPFLLSYFLQTLYGMADLFIIGQFNGVDSTTAVSIGSQVMHMLTVMIVGLAMGATVLIGRAIGSREQKQAARTVGNTITLFMTLSFLLAAGLLFAVKPITAIMSTPAEAVSGTVSYLTNCYLGIPGNGRFQESDVFCCRCLRCQHCLGLFLYRSASVKCSRRGTWYHPGSNHQCDRGHGCHFQTKNRHKAYKKRFDASQSNHVGTVKDRRPCLFTGRFYPDFLYCDYHHCQQAGTE